MGVLIAFASILVLIIFIIVQIKISNEFYSIAYEKGYRDRKYFWYCFFLTAVGYLLVIALPNKEVVTKVEDIKDELPDI